MACNELKHLTKKLVPLQSLEDKLFYKYCFWLLKHRPLCLCLGFVELSKKKNNWNPMVFMLSNGLLNYQDLGLTVNKLWKVSKTFKGYVFYYLIF